MNLLQNIVVRCVQNFWRSGLCYSFMRGVGCLALTPELARWPDCVGVACTATIVSHYTRRGAYRIHAAGVSAAEEAAVSLSHTLVSPVVFREGKRVGRHGTTQHSDSSFSFIVNDFSG